MKQIMITIAAALAFAAGPALQAQQIQEYDPEVEAFRNSPITDEEFQLVLAADDAAKAETLLKQLDDPDYAARERASEELIGLGAPTFNRLREAYRAADELETRLQIEKVVRRAYLNHHVLDHYGFLGVSMLWYDEQAEALRRQQQQQWQQQQQLRQGGPVRPPPAPPLPQVPPERVGILISQVIPDSGAERAGLQVNDVVIGMNGKPIAGKGREIQEGFSAAIRQHKPGSRLQLEIVRGAEVLNIEAILARPPENRAPQNIIKITPLYNAASERFFTWWERYFRNGAPRTEDDKPSRR